MATLFRCDRCKAVHNRGQIWPQRDGKHLCFPCQSALSTLIEGFFAGKIFATVEPEKKETL